MESAKNKNQVLSDTVNQQSKPLKKTLTNKPITSKPSFKKSAEERKGSAQQMKRTLTVKEGGKGVSDHLKKLEEKKYQNNMLKELERKRF